MFWFIKKACPTSFAYCLSMIGILLSVGCSNKQDPTVSMNVNKNAILLAGSSVSESIQNLERSERYRKPRLISVKDENMQAYKLGSRVIVDWSGPIEPLLQEVAMYSGYKLKSLGMAPAIPVLVNISHDNIEVGDIVREAHLQAKERASVVIYPKSKTIEIRYNELG